MAKKIVKNGNGVEKEKNSEEEKIKKNCGRKWWKWIKIEEKKIRKNSGEKKNDEYCKMQKKNSGKNGEEIF